MNINEIKKALDYIINKGGCERVLVNNNLVIYLRSDYKGLYRYNITCDLYVSNVAIIKDMTLFTEIKEGEDLSFYGCQFPLLINDYLKQKIHRLEQAIITVEY